MTTETRQGLVRQRPASRLGHIVKQEYPLYLFMIPGFLVTLVFLYGPMFSNVIAFMDYSIFAGWMGLESEWVGLYWFRYIFDDPYFWELITRTLFYSVIIMFSGFPASFILAMLFNELRTGPFKRTVQTISYLPHFVSWVTIASLTYIMLTSDTHGIFNNIMRFFFGGQRVIYMADPRNFPIVLVATHVYKTIGWGTIIYLAAIATLDPQLYEAAKIDGAGRWKQFLHVTFPGILPTTMILALFTIAGLMQTNFDHVYNLQNPRIRAATNVINVYTYYAGVRGRQYSLATAVGLFQGAVNAITLLTANFLGKKVTGHGLF